MFTMSDAKDDDKDYVHDPMEWSVVQKINNR